MKAILIGSLAATAYSAAATFPGLYTIASNTGDATKCCLPTGPIKITQPGGGSTQVNLEWTFASDSKCATTTLKGKSIDGGAAPDGADSNNVKITVNGNLYTLQTPADDTTPFKLDFTKASSTGSENCVATLTRTATTALPQWTYQGLYEVASKAGTTDKCCYPSGDIVIKQDSTSKQVSAGWTFDSTSACHSTAYKGKAVNLPATDAEKTTVGDVYFSDGTKKFNLEAPTTATGAFKLNVGSIGDGVTDCEVTLKSKTLPKHTYAGVYDTTNEAGVSSKKCCYPAGDVKITQDATSKQVTVGWTFENTADCYDTTVKGKTVSGTGTPDAVTGDVTFVDTTDGVKKTWVLDYPSTSSGDFELDLSSISSECSVTLDNSGYLVGLGSLVALSLSYIAF